MTARNKMDLLRMALRRKTIRELKPDYWWDAAYGCRTTAGTACAQGDYVRYWDARIGGLTLAQNASEDYRPTWQQYGMSSRSCLLFSGDDFLFSSTCPFAAATKYTILVQYEMLGAEPAAHQAFLVVSQAADAADSYFECSCSQTARAQLTFKAFDAVSGNGQLGPTSVNDGEPHVGIWTCNSDNSSYVQYLDAVEETLSTTGTGTIGVSFSGVTGADVFSVGARSSDGTEGTTSRYLYGKIAQMVIWESLL